MPSRPSENLAWDAKFAAISKKITSEIKHWRDSLPYPLPEQILDEDIVILGRKRMGKTYAAMGIVAHLVRTGRRVLVIDPLSVWHGLRHSRNLAAPGLPIILFGDEDSDVPIIETSGEAVARVMLSCPESAIIEVGHMLREQQISFMAALLGTLFHAKRKQTDPLWLVIDEADEFAPQAAGDMRPVLEQIRRIARQGRVRGFRVFSITQRAATLSKNLLSQLSTMISFGILAPQDMKVLVAWLDNWGDAAGRAQLLATIKHLPVGEAWVWCPNAGFLERVKFPPNETWDSTRTPAATITTTPPPPISPEVVNEICEAMVRFTRDLDGDDEPAILRRGAATPARPFGSAIRLARRRAKLTQVELAQRMETDPANIARLEGGLGNPTFKMLDKVAQATKQELLIVYRYRPPLEGSKLN